VPKPGAPPFVWLTWLDAQPWLGSVFAKLSFLSYLVPPVLKEINSFCATDPPQPVAPTNADIVAAATDPLKFEALIQYLKDSIYWWVWSNQCVCLPSTCYSILGQPIPALPNSQTNGVGPYDQGMKFTANAALPITSFGVRDLNLAGSPSCDIKLWDMTAGTLLWTQAIVLSIGAYTEFVCSTVTTMVVGHTYALTFRWLTGMTVILEAGGYGGMSNTAFSSAGAVDNYPTGIGVPSRVLNTQADPIQPIACTGGSPPPSPPVPGVTTPDFPMEASCTTQDVCNLAQQTLQSVTLLRSMLDLVQRRVLPFAWILGTPHVGLTGTGVVSVQDVIGVSVDMTVPGGWGSTAETPRRLIPSAGSLQGTDGTRFSDNTQLHYEHELIFFEQPWSLGIRYNFRPGVTATLTPLLPEP